MTDREDLSLVTHEDWMISAMLALNSQPKEPSPAKSMQEATATHIEEDVKNPENLPTGDSSKVLPNANLPKLEAADSQY